MLLAQELIDLLACPSTSQSLTLCEEKTLVTQDQTAVYPIISQVPWLLPNPQHSLIDWGAKLNHFNQVLLSEIKSLERDLQHARGASHIRIERLLRGKQNFIRRVSELLLPLIRAQSASKNLYDTLRDRAPNTQNLLSYEANLYRDWVWGEAENQQTADLVMNHLKTLSCEKIVVLGAGSGRLALDIHREYQPQITVATDINPLLVLAAQHILSDHTLPIYEFPLQPKTPEYVAVEHHINGQRKPDNFHFVFGDANKPCFKPGAFDLVMTPWFIDIQPLEFGRCLRQLNQYIPVGGSWVNFGSLVFNQKRDALCYAIDEVKEIAQQQGFKIRDIHEHEIPYLKSPYNAGYRMERVWTWTAEKAAEVKPLKNPQHLPSWLLNETYAVPKAPYFQQFSFMHRVYAQLTAEVDGKTSLSKIARKLSRQNKMDEEEALHLVKEFFTDLYLQNN